MINKNQSVICRIFIEIYGSYSGRVRVFGFSQIDLFSDFPRMIWPCFLYLRFGCLSPYWPVCPHWPVRTNRHQFSYNLNRSLHALPRIAINSRRYLATLAGGGSQNRRSSFAYRGQRTQKFDLAPISDSVRRRPDSVGAGDLYTARGTCARASWPADFFLLFSARFYRLPDVVRQQTARRSS